MQSAVRAIKRDVPDLLVVTDVCLCEYTSHGHCGILIDDEIANDPTVDQLVQGGAVARRRRRRRGGAVRHDGRPGRRDPHALDAARLHQYVAIMSYAAKYCSAFYGPFREAADSAPAFGDRRSHQMDPANVEEALREVELDIEEGADIVMVKPALAYLDVIARVKAEFGVPDGGVPRERRIRDAQGRGAERLDRRAAGDDGDADVDPAGRRRHDHHLLRARSRPRAAIAWFSFMDGGWNA